MITPSLDLTPEDVALLVSALSTHAHFIARYGAKAKIERCDLLASELKAAAEFAKRQAETEGK